MKLLSTIKKKRGNIVRKLDKLVQVYIDIDTATEISHATLTALMENMDDNRDQYILLGVIQQLEIIKNSITLFDSVMKEGA